MEPIIEINWMAIFQILLIFAFLTGVGMIIIRVAVAYAKRLRDGGRNDNNCI